MIDVIVPTYRRPHQLAQCLAGLRGQSVLPRRVVVVVHEGDEETAQVLREPENRHVHVRSTGSSGQVAALREGVAASDAPILAFTDDDAVPREDWIEKITYHFSDETVGAVGGRDAIAGSSEHVAPDVPVGRVGRWGRVTGNHHLGAGPPRHVDVLKGVNMAFRRVALQVPMGLRGGGAEPHNDAAASLNARQLGWTVIYDPAIVVDHYVGSRLVGPVRGSASSDDARSAAYNLTIAVLSTRAAPVWRRAIYGILVGDRGTPGIVRATFALARGEVDRGVVHGLFSSLQGQVEAIVDYLQGRRLGYG